MRFRFVLYATLVLALYLNLHAATTTITVYKDPSCGCCLGWVEHLKANGFEVVVKEVPNVQDYKTKNGVPEDLQSCHTAIVDGYVIEGHVPAAEIKRLLAEHPKAKGLAVPGMPMGSPGMEGGQAQKYSVLLFNADGKTSVFKQY
jgi:hypothetical protein